MRNRIAVAIAVLFCAAIAEARDPYRVSVWVRNNVDSVNTFNTRNPEPGTNAPMANEVNPVWYRFRIDTVNNVQYVRVEAVVRQGTLNTSGLMVVPVVQNSVSGDFSGSAMGLIFRSAADIDQHAQDIAAIGNNPAHAGVELDYEQMLEDVGDDQIAARRDAFSSLVVKIKSYLSPGKTLAVDVYRKRSATSGSRNAQAYDYAALGAFGAADFVKIMMYTDITRDASGNVTNENLVNNSGLEDSLDYANQQIRNHNKIIVALPWYGARLTGTELEGTPPAVSYDLPRTSSNEKKYVGIDGQTWVAIDEEAFRDKVLLAIRRHDVGGFAMWEAGRSVTFPEVWEVLRGRLSPAGASISAQPPEFCPPTPYSAMVASYTPPPSPALESFGWFLWNFETGNYTYKASGTPSSPGLMGGSYMLRVNGITGRRVFEAESSMFTITCKRRAVGP